MLLCWSLLTVLMVAYPAANRTLQFVSHNGIVNLYMYLVSFLMESCTSDDFYEQELETQRTEDLSEY